MSGQTTAVATTLALKEWSAAARALLDGRQTLLLRKGGIHEKSFQVAAEGSEAFVLMPTVSHSHADRVRAEHLDVLEPGAADVSEDSFVVRCGLRLVDAVPVARSEGLADIADLHIWTAASVKEDRLDFRPKHLLHALVVQAFALPSPVRVPRADAYGGCKSWVELPVDWDGASGTAVHGLERLTADAGRVRAAVA